MYDNWLKNEANKQMEAKNRRFDKLKLQTKNFAIFINVYP